MHFDAELVDLLLFVEGLLLVETRHVVVHFLLVLAEQSLDVLENVLLVLQELRVHLLGQFLLEVAHVFLT